MFIDIEPYPFLKVLQESWECIYHELKNLELASFSAWPEPIYKGEWNVFPLYAFGKKVEDFCMLCPETTHLIEKTPGLVTAGFSRLAPDTHILPHVGYTDLVLRFHLGLTQARNCRLRVGKETRYWGPGSAFLFDDTIEHEAWNQGKKERVILLLDFKRNPNLQVTFPEETDEYLAVLKSEI